MTKKTPEQEPIIHPLTGEIFSSKSEAIACMIAQLDAIEANFKTIAASLANSPEYSPERAQSLAEGIKDANIIRDVLKQALAELTEADRRDFDTDED